MITTATLTTTTAISTTRRDTETNLSIQEESEENVAIKQVSLDGNWYYLKDGDTVPTGWLSLSGQPDKNGMDWLPFAFWDVRAGEKSTATEDEAQRYEARNSKLSQLRQPQAASNYRSTFDAFVKETIAEARRLGWKIEDLNANDQGLTVKGPAWKVTPPNGLDPKWFWNEKLAALAVSVELT